MFGRVTGPLVAVFLFLCTAGFRPAGLADEGLPPVVLSPAAADALTAPPAVTIGARAGLVIDSASGQVLFEQRAAEPLPPASTTKLMTALLAVESGRYFDPITIEAGDLIGGSSMGLVAGETINLRDLLDGLLIASGNDAAVAVARHLGLRLPGPGRPVARFVGRMNSRAAELGLRQTTFRNPEGLDEPGHRMSAADLGTLALVALRQPVIAQIVATPATTVTSSRRAYAIRTTNQFLGRYPGAVGVKTGTTDAAGECLVALVEKDGRRLLTVVLGSDDRYADTTALVEWGFSHHRWLDVPPVAVELVAPAGWTASFASGPAVAAPAAQVQWIEYRLRLTSPGQAPGGAVEIVLFDRVLARRPVAMAPLGRTERPKPGW